MENKLKLKYNKNALVILLCFGLLLRLLKYLFFNHLSHDEAITYTYFNELTYTEILLKSKSSLDALTNPSGFYLFAKWWSSIYENEYWNYFPMFVSSCLTIIVSFMLAKNLIEDKSKRSLEVVVGFGFLCLSNFYIHLGGMLLTYSFSFLLTSIILLIYYLRTKRLLSKTLSSWSLTILFIVYALVDYSFIWLLVFIVIHNLLHYQDRDYKFVAMLLFTPLIDFYWLVKSFKPALDLKMMINTTEVNSFISIIENMSAFVGYSHIENKFYLNTISLLVVIVVLILIYMNRRKLSRVEKICLIQLFVIACASIFVTSIFAFKNVFFLLSIFVVLGLTYIIKAIKDTKYQVIFCVIMILIELSNIQYYHHFHYAKIFKENNYLDIIKLLDREYKEKKIAIVHNDREMEPLVYYSAKDINKRIDVYKFNKLPENYKEYDEIFFVFLIDDPRKQDDLFYESAKKHINCTNVEKVKFKGFYKFEKCIY